MHTDASKAGKHELGGRCQLPVPLHTEYRMAESKATHANEHDHTSAPMIPNSKAAAAVPKLSDDEHVELADMLPAGLELDPENDIMQLARLGDIQAIEKLYDSGKFDASYCDHEGITPLHVSLLHIGNMVLR